ncbi:hypothetical protein MKX03_002129, partial [Papaver bracteatum]
MKLACSFMFAVFLQDVLFIFTFISLVFGFVLKVGNGANHGGYYRILESISHLMYYASDYGEPQIQVANK